MDMIAQRRVASKFTHRPGRVGALMLLAGILIVFGAAVSASAATVLRLDMQSLVANSTQIVEAEVTEVEARVENGRVYTYTTVSVQDAFKGASNGDTLTIRQIGGRTKNLATRVAGSPHFRSGERVIVFLEKPNAHAPPVITGMAQGKFHIALGPDNVTPYVVPYLGDLALSAPKQVQQGQSKALKASKTAKNTARFERVKPADLYKRVRSLQEFKQQIRDVVNEQK